MMEKARRENESLGISAIDERPLDELTEEEQMKRLMGFSALGTTKGKVVATNHNTAARGYKRVKKKRLYLQYMNRTGKVGEAGFVPKPKEER
jgi:hypothetical protein